MPQLYAWGFVLGCAAAEVSTNLWRGRGRRRLLGNHQGTPTSPIPAQEGKGLLETRSKGRSLQAREGIQSAELDQSTGTTPAGTGREPASPSSNPPSLAGGAEGCREGSLPAPPGMAAPQPPKTLPCTGLPLSLQLRLCAATCAALHGTAHGQGWLLCLGTGSLQPGEGARALQ